MLRTINRQVDAAVQAGDVVEAEWERGRRGGGKHVNLGRKILCLLCDWISPGDWIDYIVIGSIPRHGGIITSLTPLHFLETSCQAL